MEQYLEEGEFDEEVLELQKQLELIKWERFFAENWNAAFLEKCVLENEKSNAIQEEMNNLLKANLDSEKETLETFAKISGKLIADEFETTVRENVEEMQEKAKFEKIDEKLREKIAGFEQRAKNIMKMFDDLKSVKEVKAAEKEVLDLEADNEKTEAELAALENELNDLEAQKAEQMRLIIELAQVWKESKDLDEKIKEKKEQKQKESEKVFKNPNDFPQTTLFIEKIKLNRSVLETQQKFRPIEKIQFSTEPRKRRRMLDDLKHSSKKRKKHHHHYSTPKNEDKKMKRETPTTSSLVRTKSYKNFDEIGAGGSQPSQTQVKEKKKPEDGMKFASALVRTRSHGNLNEIGENFQEKKKPDNVEKKKKSPDVDPQTPGATSKIPVKQISTPLKIATQDKAATQEIISTPKPAPENAALSQPGTSKSSTMKLDLEMIKFNTPGSTKGSKKSQKTKKIDSALKDVKKMSEKVLDENIQRDSEVPGNKKIVPDQDVEPAEKKTRYDDIVEVSAEKSAETPGKGSEKTTEVPEKASQKSEETKMENPDENLKKPDEAEKKEIGKSSEIIQQLIQNTISSEKTVQTPKSAVQKLKEVKKKSTPRSGRKRSQKLEESQEYPVKRTRSTRLSQKEEMKKKTNEEKVEQKTVEKSSEKSQEKQTESGVQDSGIQDTSESNETNPQMRENELQESASGSGDQNDMEEDHNGKPVILANELIRSGSELSVDVPENDSDADMNFSDKSYDQIFNSSFNIDSSSLNGDQQMDLNFLSPVSSEIGMGFDFCSTGDGENKTSNDHLSLF